MGFRSTFITSDYSIEWPEWFVDKYNRYINIGSCLSSKHEYKAYDDAELYSDIQKCLPERWRDDFDFNLVYLHECDGVTKVKITKKKIIISEPHEWKEVEYITHSYCYGCSEVEATND